jgi:hypothetical protein
MSSSNLLKNGCMGCLLVFGALMLLYFAGTFIFMGGSSNKEMPQFEVQTKKGMVKLHLGIPKDSVILLVGTPDDINSHSIGNTIVETLEYKVKNDEYCDLSFEFENGKLESFEQY